MACDCISLINKKLGERNSRVVEGIALDMTNHTARAYPVIQCEKIDKRNRDKMSVIPTFCPFCGTVYRDSDAGTEAVADPVSTIEADLLAALKGVVRVADRKTVEFDAAHAAIARAEGRAR